MDFLSKAWSQWADRFRSMSVGVRVTATLAALVVAIAAVTLARSQVAAPDLYLMNGESFSGSELQAMEAAFAASNLGSYELDGNRVRIPRGQQSVYMAALVEKNALPRNYLHYLEVAANSSSLMPDRHIHDEQMKVAKQKVLSSIIGAMKGIESAMVLWDSETRSGPLVRTTEKTASVSVKPAAMLELTEPQVASIRNLVVSSIVGLKPENVAVTDLNSGRTFCGNADASGSVSDDPYCARKRMYEQVWRKNIQDALSYVPGAIVGVNAELERERARSEKEVKHIARSGSDKARRSQDANPAGYAPTPGANHPASLPLLPAAAAMPGDDEAIEELPATAGQSVQKEIVGLTPKRVTATIGIPSSYFARVWTERHGGAGEGNQPPAVELAQIRAQEIAKIEACVAQLLPSAEDPAEQARRVTVTEFQDFAPPPAPVPDFQEQLAGWLERYGSTAGISLAALLGLFILRRIVRQARREPQRSREIHAPHLSPHFERVAAADSGRDELSELVARNPDQAADVLRGWIAGAR
jgi:flagellar M-ring protein FliF